MLQDAEGDLWIGTELGLSHLHQGLFVKDAAVRELAQDKVWALHEDSDGALWIGTRNTGLFRYQRGALTHFGSADGLASDSIYDLEEDATGRFWIIGPSGVSLLNRHELDRVAGDRGQHLSLTFYSVSSDAETVRIFGGMQSAGALTPEGDLWIPSNRGPIRISPARTVAQSPSPVVISRVLTDGRELAPHAGITLQPGETRLEITYASVMLRSQEAIRFQYKLEGLEDRWNFADKRHIADYTNLPAGNYTFRVAAYDLNRPDVLSEAAIAVVKRPHFYRTWWFIAACLLLVVALVFAAYRFRIGQLRRRFKAVLAERNRLAREVHDTLLQGCAGVSAVLETVSILEEQESALKRALLDSAREQMRTTINEAREAIWELRHEQEAPQDLAELLGTMSSRMSAELGLAIRCDVTGQPFPVSRGHAHELMMVVREAVHNAANHAEPNLVRLSLAFEEQSVAVGVADDGCGFEPAADNSEGMQFGLIGMKERVSRLGGTFRVESMLAAGTTITICVPRTINGRASEALKI
jgi:signal transduction histidine kinase